MDEMQILIDLHKDNVRQGPGSDAETRLAITLSGLRGKQNLQIADIGCGSGASTMILAEELDAEIIAIDLLPEFLEKLEQTAQKAGLADRITTRAESMEALTFEKASLDAIWSEGAIYNIGFEAGITAWRPFLKPDGILAISELTWLTHKRPHALQAHWDHEYSEVDTASAKIALLEKHGFTPIGYFPLPETCWIDNYYRPLQEQFDKVLNAYNHSDTVKTIIDAEMFEIKLYEEHRDFVSYGYYIARKSSETSD